MKPQKAVEMPHQKNICIIFFMPDPMLGYFFKRNPQARNIRIP